MRHAVSMQDLVLNEFHDLLSTDSLVCSGLGPFGKVVRGGQNVEVSL